MIFNAILLSILSTGAFWIIYAKCPPSIKKFIIKHTLFSDVVATVCTYILFGGGATVLLASAMTCIETSLLLAIGKDPELSAALSAMGRKITEFQSKASKYLKAVMIPATTNV